MLAGKSAEVNGIVDAKKNWGLSWNPLNLTNDRPEDLIQETIALMPIVAFPIAVVD